jgi:hypothetical protein
VGDQVLREIDDAVELIGGIQLPQQLLAFQRHGLDAEVGQRHPFAAGHQDVIVGKGFFQPLPGQEAGVSRQ